MSKTRKQIRRLLIVRLGSMGDIIHTLPAATALRIAFPEAMIGWVIEERWAELLCTLPTPRSGPRSPQRPLVDHLHTVNTKKWRRSIASLQTIQELAATFSELRAQDYELAVDFQGAIRSALIARWSGATETCGMAQPRENIASMLYTQPRMAQGVHIVEQNLSLAAAVIGEPAGIAPIEFPHEEAAEKACCERLRQLGIEGFALLNPGAGWGSKCWPAGRYAEVARQLFARGLPSLINFGPGEETLAREVESASSGAAKAMASNLTQLIALTRRAAIFIGGDTGPMHLAAALNVPVVAIFGPTDPGRNGPFAGRSVILRNPASATSYSHLSQPDQGLLEVTPGQVIAAAENLLGDSLG